MELPYTRGILISPDSITCQILNTARIDFSNAVLARKSAETLVRRAEGGERIITKSAEGRIEHIYTAKVGEAIFINLHNPTDTYVPGNADGTRWQFQELEQKGYVITGDDPVNGGIRIKSTKSFKILHEAVEKPTCIKNAWGTGQHVFLFAGASLKLHDDGHVSGIDKSAFDRTWEMFALTAPLTQVTSLPPSPYKMAVKK
jgi:hypothetical protein